MDFGLANIQTYGFTQPPKRPRKFQQHNSQVSSLKSLCLIWVIDCRGQASIGMEMKKEAQEWGKGPDGTEGQLGGPHLPNPPPSALFPGVCSVLRGRVLPIRNPQPAALKQGKLEEQIEPPI